MQMIDSVKTENGNGRQGGLTSTVVVLKGDDAMSVPCLFDRRDKTFLVGTGVPVDVFEKQVGKCQAVDCDKLQNLASGAQPAIGFPGRCGYIRRTTAHLRELGHTFEGVDPDRIDEARRIVPVQRESWTCGVNSGARFAAMLRQSIKNYWPYVHGAPKYGGFLKIPDIGPNPEGLQNHLKNQSELRGTELHQVCNVRFHPLWESFVDSVFHKKRPALVLFMNSSTSLHWVCLLGKNNATGNWIYLDTDNSIWEMPGGDDELKHRMNVGNTVSQRFGFVERFNCIVSSGECHEKD